MHCTATRWGTCSDISILVVVCVIGICLKNALHGCTVGDMLRHKHTVLVVVCVIGICLKNALHGYTVGDMLRHKHTCCCLCYWNMSKECLARLHGGGHAQT